MRSHRVPSGGWFKPVAALALAIFLGASGFLGVAGLAAEVDKKVARPGENAMGGWLKRLGRVHLPDENERSHNSVTGIFRGIVGTSSRSTVRVVSDGVQSSLGVVVHEDGYVLTKASELQGNLECVLADGRRTPASRVSHRPDLDLALLKVSAGKLPVIQWSGASVPAVGSWLVTANVDGEPAAIGVVSTAPREIPVPRPVLGIRLNQADNGVRVQRVIPGTGAERAGIRAGDVISSINGRSAPTPDALTDLIQAMNPGDKVTLAVRRETESLSVVAELSDLARLGDQDQAALMDSLGGPLSRRRAGFSSVIQHDSVVRPRDCGGPIVDLDGKAIGINIARASRVATYALPVTTVLPAVEEMLQQATSEMTVNAELTRKNSP